ncbi:acyl-CoA carboxylase epsilon subunit [Kitasatospora azatica]|uniref:acyl-CoA carboxylase epsilon subunit n=1 Tax=Kitasatospora azatica TaxID=58347 RepID=UPI0007C64621|nr:acyl-CoA carboxylase epsilon subunit [Kitasatospora azatica]
MTARSRDVERGGLKADLIIVRGSPTDQELAALTAVLLARAAATGYLASAVRFEPTARRRRPEHRLAYRSPVSWQQAA